MDLSELIIERKTGTVKIDDNLENISGLELITEQEGDIPSLMGLYSGDLFFEITVRNTIVIGIQFDFRYEMATSNRFEVGNMGILLNENTSIQELANYVEKLNLAFEVIESKTEPKKLSLKTSETNFYFDDENRLLKLISH